MQKPIHHQLGFRIVFMLNRQDTRRNELNNCAHNYPSPKVCARAYWMTCRPCWWLLQKLISQSKEIDVTSIPTLSLMNDNTIEELEDRTLMWTLPSTMIELALKRIGPDWKPQFDCLVVHAISYQLMVGILNPSSWQYRGNTLTI